MYLVQIPVPSLPFSFPLSPLSFSLSSFFFTKYEKSGGDDYIDHPPQVKKWGGYIPPIPPGISALVCIPSFDAIEGHISRRHIDDVVEVDLLA